MLVLLPFAFLSGLVTILSPCILPVLPVVLSGSVGGKSRPFGVITGFVVSFSIFTLILSSIVQALNIPPDALRVAAVVLILLFGLVMLVPRLRDGFEKLASRLAKVGGTQKQSKGFAGGLLIGASLGLVWTPCVGPIMASVISLAITQSVDGGSVIIILVYSLGTAIPMLAIMLGGRTLLKRVPALSRNTAKIQRVFGVLMILVAVTIAFGWDRSFQSAILRIFPNYGTGLTAFENTDSVQGAIQARAESVAGFEAQDGSYRLVLDATPTKGNLADYGPAPEIVTKGEWFNIDGLGDAGADGIVTMDELKGKVVLLDFWTYSCVNCVRTIPHLRAWYDAYRDDGFVIIGVHTPEFAFERKPENVRKAMKELGVNWPVVMDNEYSQWQVYNNRYWPAHYFIDAAGRVRYYHFGEGKYDIAEDVIRALLEEADSLSADRAVETTEADLESNTAETYLGYGRARGFASAVTPVPNEAVEYNPARTPANGEWTLNGTWTIAKEYVVPEEKGVLELGFYAKDVFLVIEPAGEDGRIEVKVDGVPVEDTDDVQGGMLRADESRLYHLFGKAEPGEHILNLEVNGNVRLFAFTFG
jgi:cytochrome c biogenesis protein CcdA/thiol-disulfide isomerase/thioredoxin